MMYVQGTRSSNQPSLKQFESKFFEIAQAKVQAGIRDGDRLLDVIKALVMMAGYMFTNEWYNIAYNISGSAIR